MIVAICKQTKAFSCFFLVFNTNDAVSHRRKRNRIDIAGTNWRNSDAPPCTDDDADDDEDVSGKWGDKGEEVFVITNVSRTFTRAGTDNKTAFVNLKLDADCDEDTSAGNWTRVPVASGSEYLINTIYVCKWYIFACNSYTQICCLLIERPLCDVEYDLKLVFVSLCESICWHDVLGRRGAHTIYSSYIPPMSHVQIDLG